MCISLQCRVTTNQLWLLVTDANKDSVIRKIKETKMLESKISKEDLIRANVDKDRVIRAITRYAESLPVDGEKQLKFVSTNGVGISSLSISQREVYEFTDSILSAEFLGLVDPEDIVDVRDDMHLEGSHPVWGWKISGFGMDGRPAISLCYMEIPFKFFRF